MAAWASKRPPFIGRGRAAQAAGEGDGLVRHGIAGIGDGSVKPAVVGELRADARVVVQAKRHRARQRPRTF